MVSRTASGALARTARGPLADVALSVDEFAQLREVIRDLTGISMADSKRQLVYRRLASRLRVLRLNSFQDYIGILRSGNSAEHEHFCNAVTTNLTAFFRENHHFDYLKSTILPHYRQMIGGSRLRIWSAGCSTGEEPYSIAITLREAVPELETWDAKILATDIDSDVLATGRDGIYEFDRVEKLSESRLRRWFQRSKGQHGNKVRVRPPLRDLITFKQLNLINDWPMSGPFDIVFCRNVIIYFDKPTQRVLVDRFAELIRTDGYLILGHSESLLNVSDRFELIGQTIYRKVR